MSKLIERAAFAIVFVVALIGSWLYEPLQTWTQNRFQPHEPKSIPPCQTSYTARIVMYEPFVMHIQNFISPAERAYLLELGKPLLQQSQVVFENGTTKLDKQRTSSSGFLGRTDPVVKCVLERAAEIQGFASLEALEDLQMTAYAEGQEYQPHYDWFYENMVPMMGGSNRGSTFFATIEADCEHCGTQFPRLPVDFSAADPRWCELVECDNQSGLTIKAVAGSAVFWRNLDKDGWGDHKVLHAGLPVAQGSKIGVNIWTRVAAPGPVT